LIQDADELLLVQRATVSTVTGDCEWDERAARRVRQDPELQGLTPEGIKELLQDYVANQGGQIQQVPETRPEYSYRRFYYKVIVPVDGFRHGLFTEIVLSDEDPNDPAVRIVNAHEQKR
jgi:hypothetical protein